MYPTVSVIIPFYNRLSWLEEAIKSVLVQSCKDYEIILVDDGSNTTYNFLPNISDNRIRYVRQENRGPAAARNLGIELSQGKFVAFLDSDDLWLPNKLEIQLRYMQDNPKIGLSHTSYTRMSPKGDLLEKISSGKFTGYVYPKIILSCPIATPTVIIRKNILNNIKFNEGVKIGEDVILWIQISKQHKILGIDIPLTKVRIHGDNAAIDIHKNLHGNLNIINYTLENDNDLDFISKKKARSRFYNIKGQILLQKNHQNKSIQFFFKGLLYWPMERNNFIMLIKCILTEKYFNILRNIIKKAKAR
jgi:glycosyltransferase involved in cell wall biosynthesis